MSTVYILEKAGSRRKKETVTGTTLAERRWWDLEMGVALEQEEDFPSAPRGKGSWGGFRSGLGEQLLLRPQ